jgi:hypothetical protein
LNEWTNEYYFLILLHSHGDTYLAVV